MGSPSSKIGDFLSHRQFARLTVPGMHSFLLRGPQLQLDSFGYLPDKWATIAPLGTSC